MKVVLFVEGYTEKKALPDFLRGWLDARLPERIGFKIVRFDGWAQYYKDIAASAELNLSGKNAADVIAGIGLLDLHGPTFYPSGKRTAGERYAWAKAHLEGRVGHPKFRQHFAVHETEAWLLSDPAGFPKEIRTALPARCAQPETVNFDEPPSKLLERLYRDKSRKVYKKVTDGAILFRSLDPDVACAKCPRLKGM